MPGQCAIRKGDLYPCVVSRPAAGGRPGSSWKQIMSESYLKPQTPMLLHPPRLAGFVLIPNEFFMAMRSNCCVRPISNPNHNREFPGAPVNVDGHTRYTVQQFNSPKGLCNLNYRIVNLKLAKGQVYNRRVATAVTAN